MYSFIVGCDMSKAFFDVSYWSDGQAIYLGRFANQRKGFKKMMCELKEKTDCKKISWLICFENTGVYSKALLEWLYSQQIPCREENALRIQKSTGLRRGKDDKMDSKRICQYAFEKRDTLEASTLADPLITQLKKLLSRRTLLVKHKTALSNSLKEQKSILDPELYESIQSQNENLLALYNQQIQQIDRKIKEVLKANEKLKKNAQLTQSVIGIGPITSAFIIAFTENFTCFTEGRRFASFCGIAPFPNESGTRSGPAKVSPMANKKIKGLLSNGVQAAIQHDPQIRNYFQKKKAEGKHEGCIYNAIKNKMIHRLFAVIKRQTPYVKLPAYV